MNRDFLDNIVTSLHHECIDLEAIQVTTIDGVTIASLLPENINEDELGFQSSSMIALASQVSKTLGLGELINLSASTKDNMFAFKTADNELLLSVKCSKPFDSNFDYECVNRAAEYINNS